MGFPPGHYYSPIPDPAELLQREDQIWARRKDLAGVDMQIPQQLELMQKIKPLLKPINYPVDAPSDPSSYYYMNGMFPVLDAEFLFGALCLFKPKRVIEVGSGFSSLVMADVNRRMFHSSIDITCIEPYPRDFLIAGVEGISRLVRRRLQDVDLKLFDNLESGDVLFIDSSHVCKTGSDVNFLFFELLPRLKSGVFVHLHDIFLPDEYPKAWVIQEERSWSEQYLLHGFLMFNSQWRVVWMAHYLMSRHPEMVSSVFTRCPELGAGGSFWMQRL